ncbi:hypothetical protein, partial [Pseudomonas aeruginosa]
DGLTTTINRLRKAVYEAVSGYRLGRNG